MKRNEFIKGLGLSALGLGTLSLTKIIDTRQVKIYDNYLRGVFAGDTEKIFEQLSLNLKVSLVREKENKYDKFAIAVYFKNYKLGYIAAYENIVLANMMDSEVNLNTVISHIEHNHYDEKIIAVQVFCNLVSPTPLLIKELDKRADDEFDQYRSNY